MFTKLKNLMKKVLFSPEPAASKSNSKPSSTRKKSPPPPKRPSPSRSRRPSPAPSSGTEKPSSRSRHSSGERPQKKAAPVPVRPEKLREVPVIEGKLRFLDLPLAESVQFGIQHAGFEYCTPIQQMTLPILLDKRDLAGKAQTGTGKTAAFLLAAFTRMLNEPLAERRDGAPRMAVLAPTRELAIQIHKDACELGIFSALNIVLVFGGMDHEAQRRSLAGPIDVLIGTPGRVIDFSRSRALDLSRVEILVIDEADRMLDMGFIPDVKRIVTQMPEKGRRQTLLFSATLDEKILKLASGWLAEPAVVESEPEKMVSDNIAQTFYSVLREEKLALLLYILRTMTYDRILIFGNRKDVNLKLQYDLARYGYSVPLLSGDISQEKRIKILEKFRAGTEKVVIATDVAARGIHVDDVSIVINYDLPEQPEDYVHRIGRTGRAGHHGTAISFLCEYGAYYLPPIEEQLHTRFSSILPTEEMLTLPPEVPGAKLPPRPGTNSRRGGGGRSFRRGGNGTRRR